MTNKPPLNNHQQSVYDYMKQLLHQWGIGSLAGEVRNLLVKGDTTASEVTLALEQTTAYKQRFAGNELREKNGLPVLSPSQYVALEDSYQQVLRSYGLPHGFYNSHQDFVKMIGNDLSPTELQTRAQIAHDQYMAAPPQWKQLWAQYFGTKGDAIAAILDPKVATAVIQNRANQVMLGGTASQYGVHIDHQMAQTLNRAGVTQSQAQSGFSQVASNLGTDASIAQRFGTSFGKNEEIKSTLLGTASAADKKQMLYDEESAMFSSKNATTNPSSAFGVSENY